MPDAGTRWHKVANAADIAAGEVLQVSVDGAPVAVYNLEGTFYATSDVCTHAEAFLSDGFIEGDTVECPLHQALFHIPTGKVLREPALLDLKTYPVRHEDGVIYIELSTEEP